MAIPKGKFKITSTGRGASTEIRTPSGDLIFASEINIKITGIGFCTAVIEVPNIPIDIEVEPDHTAIVEKSL